MKYSFLSLMLLLTSILVACSDDNNGSGGGDGGETDVLTLELIQQNLDIIRETPSGNERMIYFNLYADDQESLKGLTLYLEKGAYTAERVLIDPSGSSKSMMNTAWIPAGITTGITFSIQDTDKDILYEDAVDLKLATKELVIPMSNIVKKEDLDNLMLRGTNYYPRYNCWGLMWTQQTPEEFESDFEEMKQLNTNTIRTFYIYQYPATHLNNGAFTPETISRINTLYSVADRHKQKVMMCLEGGRLDFGNLNDSKRYMRTGMEPFLYDGRVLMWDLINEPGGSDGPNANPTLAKWMQEMYAFSTALDPFHMNTVGLAWQFDQLHQLGIEPPIEQYHQYSGSIGVPDGSGSRNIRDDLRAYNTECKGRPIIMGEFGTGDSDPDGYQEQIYRWVIEGSEAAVERRVKLLGIYNWCAFHYPNHHDPKEANFGAINADGSLKPAGVFLKDVYKKWKEINPAPWE